MLWGHSPLSGLTALLALHALAHIDRNMLLGFSPQITRDPGIGSAQYGLLAGAVWLPGYGVKALFTGRLADRVSRTRVMAAGLLFWSGCTAASGVAQRFEQMVAARFLVAADGLALASVLSFGRRRAVATLRPPRHPRSRTDPRKDSPCSD